MWLNNSMRLLALATLLDYLQTHELYMLIVWQYHKPKWLYKGQESPLSQSHLAIKRKYDNKVIAVISLNKTTNDEDE